MDKDQTLLVIASNLQFLPLTITSSILFCVSLQYDIPWISVCHVFVMMSSMFIQIALVALYEKFKSYQKANAIITPLGIKMCLLFSLAFICQMHLMFNERIITIASICMITFWWLLYLFTCIRKLH